MATDFLTLRKLIENPDNKDLLRKQLEGKSPEERRSFLVKLSNSINKDSGKAQIKARADDFNQRNEGGNVGLIDVGSRQTTTSASSDSDRARSSIARGGATSPAATTSPSSVTTSKRRTAPPKKLFKAPTPTKFNKPTGATKSFAKGFGGIGQGKKSVNELNFGAALKKQSKQNNNSGVINAIVGNKKEGLNDFKKGKEKADVAKKLNEVSMALQEAGQLFR